MYLRRAEWPDLDDVCRESRLCVIVDGLEVFCDSLLSSTSVSDCWSRCPYLCLLILVMSRLWVCFVLHTVFSLIVSKGLGLMWFLLPCFVCGAARPSKWFIIVIQSYSLVVLYQTCDMCRTVCCTKLNLSGCILSICSVHLNLRWVDRIHYYQDLNY